MMWRRRPTYVVNAAPTGPPAPASGWRCVMADAFNPAHPPGQSTSIFAPNRDNDQGNNVQPGNPCPAFNGNEVETFDAGQVLPGRYGVDLVARFVGSGHYVSGCLSSQPVDPVGGQAGFKINGFGFRVAGGLTYCAEMVCILPSNVGEDCGFWACDGKGSNEIDFAEWTNYAQGHPGQTTLTSAWFNHVTGENQQSYSYNVPAQTDSRQHRWTSLIDGTALTTSLYLDGRLLASYPWIRQWPDVYLNLLVSHALRDAFPGQGPTFTGISTWRVRSIGFYQPVSQAGQNVVGGGVAPGTVVR